MSTELTDRKYDINTENQNVVSGSSSVQISGKALLLQAPHRSIAVFARALQDVSAVEEGQGGDEYYGVKSYRPFNRGRKLRRVVEEPDDYATSMSTSKSITSIRRRIPMWLVHSIDQPYDFAHEGKQKALYRRGMLRIKGGNIVDEEEDPYADISLADSWSIPEKLEDVRHIKSMVNTLRSRQIKLLSCAAMVLVEEENNLQKLLNTFISFLQEDSPLLGQQFLRLGDGEVDLAMVEEVKGNAMSLVWSSKEYLDRLTELANMMNRIHAQKKALAKKLLIL